MGLGMIAAEAGVKAGIGGAMGMVNNWIGNKQQVNQQERLQNLQIRGQKEMANYNYDLQKRMLDETNYKYQVEQMEKAGLNVGMMYGMSGAGGATTGSQGGSVAGATAESKGTGMDMQTIMAMEMQKAQIELAKSQANKNNVEAGVTAETGIDSAKAGIKNTLASALETEMRNNYMGEGAYKDGMTGYQVKYQQEAAQMYATSIQAEVAKLNLSQMPQELQLKIQEVAIKGMQMKIDYMNAKTNEQRNSIQWNVAKMGQELQRELQGNTIRQGNEQFGKSMEQKDQDQIIDFIRALTGAITTMK